MKKTSQTTTVTAENPNAGVEGGGAKAPEQSLGARLKEKMLNINADPASGSQDTDPIKDPAKPADDQNKDKKPAVKEIKPTDETNDDDFISSIMGEKKDKKTVTTQVTKEDGDEDPAGDTDDNKMTGEAGKKFAEYRTKNVQLSKDVERLTQEIEQLKATGGNSSELESAINENKDLKKRLASLGVKYTPEYVSKKEAKNTLTSEISTILKDSSVELDDVGDIESFVSDLLASSPNNKSRRKIIGELVENMDRFDATRFQTAILEHDKLIGDLKNYETDPDKLIKKWTEDQVHQTAAQKESTTKFLKSFITSYKSPYLKQIQGNEEWNQALEQSLQDANKQWNDSEDLGDLARMTVEGTAGVKMRDITIRKLRSMVADLTTQLQSKKSATPGPGNRNNKSQEQDDAGDEELTLGQRIKKKMTA